jgi:hypothetical protein
MCEYASGFISSASIGRSAATGKACQTERAGGEHLHRARRFRTSSKGSYGEGPARAAYVLDVSALPRPAKGKEWQRIDSFRAVEGGVERPRLKISCQDSGRQRLRRRCSESERKVSSNLVDPRLELPVNTPIENIRFPTRLRNVLAAAA